MKIQGVDASTLKWVRDEEGEVALAESTGVPFTAYRAELSPGITVQVARSDDDAQTRATLFTGVRPERLTRMEALALWTACLDSWV